MIVGNTFYLFLGAMVAGLIGGSVWAWQDQPGFDLAMAPLGLVLAQR